MFRYSSTRLAHLLVAVGAGSLLMLGCGPSDTDNNNNNPQPDAYVFPDASARRDSGACENRCTEGAKQCVAGGFQVCGDFDTDDCVEWGPVTACVAGEKCLDGTCQAGCTNVCTENSVRCTDDGTGTESCALSGTSGCWEWSPAVACDPGETCSAGTCATGCSDECTYGSRQCSGNGYQVCDDYDTDDCMDWGPVTACTGTETCSSGYCDTECTNECTAGSTQCAGTTGTQACGDYDSDACLEWGPVVPCDVAGGETCSHGACDLTCTDECAAIDDVQCTPSGAGYQVCAFWGASPCLVWGTVVSCDPGDSCTDGDCVESCECDFNPGICEPGAPGTQTACPCDPDCSGTVPCGSDGHCDTWCPAGSDPDCTCACNYNEYCEAAAQGSTDTCACDPDCELNEIACMDDGHCDTWCPKTPTVADPDCVETSPGVKVDPCRARWMEAGYREADQMWLSGAYTNPDPDEGAPWVLLSPGLSSGMAEMSVELAAEHIACVDQIRLMAWGYDDSLFGNGAEMYLFNWDTFQYDLLPDETLGDVLGDTEGWWENIVAEPSPYLLCGSGDGAKCWIDVRFAASAVDNTHVWDAYVDVYMTP